jgi:hypothetical protein
MPNIFEKSIEKCIEPMDRITQIGEYNCQQYY